MNSAIELRASSVKGKVTVTTNEIPITWVKYKHINPEIFTETTFADAFLVFTQLKKFAQNPFKYIPEGVEPRNVYVFCLYEDLVKDIAPHVIKLHHHGAPTVVCFLWDEGEYISIEAISAIYNLVEIVKEPSLYQDFKQNIREQNNGIYRIEDLAYIRSLKNLANAI